VRADRFLIVTPRYLRLPLTQDEQLTLDDAIIAHGIELRDAVRWEAPLPGLFDLLLGAAPLIEIATTALGRSPTCIARIEGLVPFDWRSFDGLSALEGAMPRLPGFLPGKGVFRFFGADESRPPHLWASHESVGLQLAGLADEPDLRSWLEAFAEATSTWPLRTLG
jgi:hypothetical protein